MIIKRFKCGLCDKEKRYWMVRHSLKKHLKEVHKRREKITNFGDKEKKIKQKWWIEEEVEE